VLTDASLLMNQRCDCWDCRDEGIFDDCNCYKASGDFAAFQCLDFQFQTANGTSNIIAGALCADHNNADDCHAHISCAWVNHNNFSGPDLTMSNTTAAGHCADLCDGNNLRGYRSRICTRHVRDSVCDCTDCEDEWDDVLLPQVSKKPAAEVCAQHELDNIPFPWARSSQSNVIRYNYEETAISTAQVCNSFQQLDDLLWLDYSGLELDMPARSGSCDDSNCLHCCDEGRYIDAVGSVRTESVSGWVPSFIGDDGCESEVIHTDIVGEVLWVTARLINQPVQTNCTFSSTSVSVSLTSKLGISGLNKAGPHRHVYEGTFVGPYLAANGITYAYKSNSLFTLAGGQETLFLKGIFVGNDEPVWDPGSYYRPMKIVQNTLYFVTQESKVSSFVLKKIDLEAVNPRVVTTSYPYAQLHPQDPCYFEEDADILHFLDYTTWTVHWLHPDGHEESVALGEHTRGRVTNMRAHWPYVTLAVWDEVYTSSVTFLRVSVAEGVQRWGGTEGLSVRLNHGNWGILGGNLYVVEVFGQYSQPGVTRISQISFDGIKSVIMSDLWASVGLSRLDHRTFLYSRHMIEFFGNGRIFLFRGKGLIQIEPFSLPWRPGPLYIRR
jgi:hypothetical protein